MGDVQPEEQAETAEAEPGAEPVEGFVDPFEDDWDDASMGESLKEWERLLQDSQEDEINSLNPGSGANPLTPTEESTLEPSDESAIGGESGGAD